MAFRTVKTVARLLGPNLFNSCVTNRCLLPISCQILHLNGTPSTSYQQCRTKKSFRDYKFNKPLNFDHSGDTKTLQDLQKDELLYKYRDIPEIQELPDDLKKIFTVEFASAKEKLAHQHMLHQDKMCEELGPGHNLEKQIAYLTVKIRNLIPKTVKGRSNKCQKVHLLERIAKRNKFLGYLRQLDFKRYEWIQHELGITYTPFNKYNYHRPGRKAARKLQARNDALQEVRNHLQQCEKQFAQELEKVHREKEALLKEVKQYELDAEKLADTFMKDMREKRRRKPKLSPKFREFEEEKKRKKLEESFVV